jgi:MFS family permease
VLTALVACISEKTWFYTLATFSLTYAVGTLGLPRETILTGVIWGAVGALFTIPLFGLLGDMISKRAIFIAGALGISLFSATFFSLLDEKTAYHTNIAMLVAFGLVYAAMYAQESSLFSSMFPPDVATYLLSLGGGSPRFIVLYLAGLGLIAAACGVLMRPYGKPQGASGAKLASAATPSIR